jgi:hypothetical protein
VAKITVNLPNRPKDELIEVAGLGTFENGYQHELTDDHHVVALAHNLEIPEEVGEPLLDAQPFVKAEEPTQKKDEDEKKGGDE